jgi:hypothetical protein
MGQALEGVIVGGRWGVFVGAWRFYFVCIYYDWIVDYDANIVWLCYLEDVQFRYLSHSVT